MEYRKLVIKRGQRCPYILTRDDCETVEATGIISVGNKKQKGNFKEIFGTLPNVQVSQIFCK